MTKHTTNRRQFISAVSRAAIAAAAMPALLSGCGKKRNFKLGVCDWTLNMTGNPESFKVGKAIGLDGIQVSFPFTPKNPAVFATPEQCASVKSAMKATGLECASTASTGFNNFPFATTDGAVEQAIACVKAAADFGSHDILLPFYGKASLLGADKRMKPELFKLLVERLKLVAPVAEKLGVSIGMENSINADDSLRIIDAVGSPAVKVYFDIFNYQYYGFETVPEMKKLKGHINQIHLKDKGHRLDSMSGCPRDMNACFEAILEIGYDGWLVFELHGHNPKKDGTVFDVLKHNTDFVKNSVLFS